MDCDITLNKLLQEYGETAMSVPDIEFQPHLLISKVRKHYMDYIIKMLCTNYETSQKLVNKNIYLPSAIWRCAKYIEMNAAQTSMMVSLYRQNLTYEIKCMKKDTNKGRLYKKLYDCLSTPPYNEKKVQTRPEKEKECTCQCSCMQRKRRRLSESPKPPKETQILDGLRETILNTANVQYVIPVIENLNTNSPKAATNYVDMCNQQSQTQVENVTTTAKPSTRLSVESQDDELTLQLEKLFYSSSADDDDLFEGTLCDTFDFSAHEEFKKSTTIQEPPKTIEVINKQDSTLDTHTAAIMKSLDERLASLAGFLSSTNETAVVPEKPKEKRKPTKWLCEEYFLKIRLHEVLDQIRDNNRKKFSRIKQLFVDLFGDNDDDDEVVSPLEESSDFIVSCKERIAPWVIKLLTPYYMRGRIKGKALFKSLAKHLIKLIYQCSHYPSEYEVHHFISDFLENHKMIRCEADFKQFRIENI